MQLFRLTTYELSPEQMAKLYDRMADRLAPLTGRTDGGVRLDWEEDAVGKSLTCSGCMPGFDLKNAAPVWELAGSALADFIVADLEPIILEDMLYQEHGEWESEEEFRQVLVFCRDALGGTEERQQAEALRRQKVARVARSYLETETLLILEGFIRFRLRDYLDELRDAVEYGFGEYWSDRQYWEFISLLKYFVYIQDTRIPVAHLLHRGGGEFLLLDGDLQPIDPNEFDQLTIEVTDGDFELEDKIVSALISVAPQTIYIHTREPDEPIVQTIRQIFDKRAELCTVCPICANRLGRKRGVQPKE